METDRIVHSIKDSPGLASASDTTDHRYSLSPRFSVHAPQRHIALRPCLHLAVQDYQLASTTFPDNVRHRQIKDLRGDSLHYISEPSLLGRATIADYLYSDYFHPSFHSPSLFRIDSIVHTGHGAQRP